MSENNQTIKKNRKKGFFILMFFIFISLMLIITQVSCCLGVNLMEQSVSVSDTIEDPGLRETETAETIPEKSTTLKWPQLHLISKLKVPGQAIDVKAEGGYAYLTNDLGILFIIDVRDKENPVITGKCTGIDAANIVLIQEEYAYVSYTSWMESEEPAGDTAAGSEEGGPDIYSICGFKIINIEDKRNPYIAGDYISGQYQKKSVQDLHIDGDYAYLNTTLLYTDRSDSRFELIDIKNKKRPELIGSCEIEGQPNGLFVQGDYAYLNNTYYDFQKKEYRDTSNFFVIDIKSKKSPRVINSCEVPANSWSVYVRDDKAYLTSSVFDPGSQDYINSVLQIVDITDPDNPEVLGKCGITGGAWEIDSKDDYLLISNNEGGVSAVDISDSSNPSVVSVINTSGNSYDIAISGDYGYIADGFGGLKIIGLQKKEEGEGMILEEQEYDENRAPVAALEVFGDETEGGYYVKNNPVFLSAIDSYDPDDDKIEFAWQINDIDIIDNYSSSSMINMVYENYGIDSAISEKGDEVVCFFENPGKYELSLTVEDGNLSDIEKVTIEITDQIPVINPIKEHTFDVEIECIMLNNSDILLKDIECFLKTPQSYYPYQLVNSVEASTSDADEVFDGSRNLITHLEYDKSLTVGEGEELKASIISNVSMYEYDFKNINTKGLDYAQDDMDLINYTGEDLFIDIDDPVIITAAKKAVGNETDPVDIARKLYFYVINKLYYDFPRAEEEDYEFMNASEILKTGKGVCADYAILYTALLRASGIPSRIVAGIPVMLTLKQKDNELDVGHAWVEVKLPGYGWVPVDITQEYGFMNIDYFLNLSTEKGTSFLYERQTMDPENYYFDGFLYDWDETETPDVKQSLIFRVKNLELDDILSFNS
jgi:hypothetical protein